MNVVKKLFKAREISSFLCLLAMFLLVGLVNPSFLKPQNIMLCFNGSIVYILIAVGMAFVILTGEIDCSIGAQLGLAAAVCATFLKNEAPWGVAILLALLVGLVCGTINGFGVTVLHIPSIIMTLGTNGIYRGLIYVYTQGKWVENLPAGFKGLAQTNIFGNLCWFFVMDLVIMLLVFLYLRKTRHGKRFAAVGDNEMGADLIGIPVARTKMLAFIICGAFSALGAVLYVSRVGFVTAISGNGYEMKAIAACVIGGISLSGGVGTVAGATIGGIIMASISRLLVFLKISSDYDNTITGILLIAIVVIDSLAQRRSVEKARRERLAARVTETEGGADHE
ncbi:ABC transporter permease [Hespellia stercorisuis]|uniref:Autoinducer 2 import system permease protein LsrC n=1 Tax=Hespellia stercorisuis DSM 15480 TaxID=1121950 RepID=A0A1M6J5N0_9FIRM|nr:ABC transporter permease [Hespellia stercorisuis]SHJ41998.1 monosaccharide ABC transporter membrane protein, CUT2 family (TC 3.A.1.2.-) [Hespellia stercorisuis DSM 15480]